MAIKNTRFSFFAAIVLYTLFSCKKVYITEAAPILTDTTASIPAPVITSFSPGISWYNQIVEITGANFSKELADNVVMIGSVKVEITEAGATKLKIRIPQGLQSGNIHVRTKGRETISDRQLIIKQLAWQKLIGGKGDDYTSSVFPVPGGYIVTGYTNSTDGDITAPNNGDVDLWYAKLDSAQHIVWQKSLGGSGEDRAIAAAPAPGGGLIIAAYSNSPDRDFKDGWGGGDIWIIKVDNDGNVIWKKAIGGSDVDYPNGIAVAADGTCVIAGYTYSSDHDVAKKDYHGNGDMWVVKLDAAGKNIMWQAVLGSTGAEDATAVVQDSDGGWLVAGSTDGKPDGITKDNMGWKDAWVVKLNANGATVWQKTLGGSGIDIPASIIPTGDGGAVLACNTNSKDGDVLNPYVLQDIWIVNLSAGGGIRWQRTLGGSHNDYVNSIIPSGDGGYVITAATQSRDHDLTGNRGYTDAWIVKLDADRKIAAQRTLGGSDFDGLAFVVPGGDGSFIAAGSTSSGDGDIANSHAGSFDMWLFKIFL